MKRITGKLLIVLAFSCVLLPSCSIIDKAKRSDRVVTNRHIYSLLSELEIFHDGTLDGIVNSTQKLWLRPKNKERWQIADKYIDRRSELLPLLRRIGCIDEVKPKKRDYDYALFLGCALFRARKRLAHLIKLYKQGIRFNSIVVLSGQRPLDNGIESREELLMGDESILPIRRGWRSTGEMPKTEIDMIRLLFEQTGLPDGMRNIPVTGSKGMVRGGDQRQRIRQSGGLPQSQSRGCVWRFQGNQMF